MLSEINVIKYQFCQGPALSAINTVSYPCCQRPALSRINVIICHCCQRSVLSQISEGSIRQCCQRSACLKTYVIRDQCCCSDDRQLHLLYIQFCDMGTKSFHWIRLWIRILTIVYAAYRGIILRSCTLYFRVLALSTKGTFQLTSHMIMVEYSTHNVAYSVIPQQGQLCATLKGRIQKSHTRDSAISAFTYVVTQLTILPKFLQVFPNKSRSPW